MSFAGWDTLSASSVLLGAYALSFLAAASSSVVAGLPSLWRPGPARGAHAGRLAAAAALPVVVALVLGFVGARRTAQYEARLRSGEVATTRPMVAIQGDVPQSLKRDATDPERKKDPEEEDPLNAVFRRHVDLVRTALERESLEFRDPFAVLWPETMIPWPFVDPSVAAVLPAEWENQVRVLQTVGAGTPPGQDVFHLLGAIALVPKDGAASAEPGGNAEHDSLFLVRSRDLPRPEDPYPPPPGPQGPAWQVGRHDKVILVPGGEYTPLGDLLPPLRWLRDALDTGIPELEPGAPDQAPFDLGVAPRSGFPTVDVRAGTVICFEVLFPAACRSWRLRGAQVLLNPANYGWFGGTAAEQADFRAQLRALVRLRAVETGTTIGVAGNRAPTMFFDPLGREEGLFFPADAGAAGASLPAGSDETAYRAGWATGVLRLEGAPGDGGMMTPYVRWGDWPWAAVALALVGFTAVTRRRRPAAGADPSEPPPAADRSG
jgi:apolipoprotein N-acyltransferase